MKICTQCERAQPLENFRKYAGRSCDGYRPLCRNCQRRYEAAWRKMNQEKLKQRRMARSDREKKYRASYDAKRRGYLLLMEAKRRARRKHIPFDLDQHVQEVEERIQAGACEMTGLPLNLYTKGTQWNSPSLDRITPSLGYIYSNMRIVCFAMNAAMGRWGEKQLRTIMYAWLERK